MPTIAEAGLPGYAASGWYGLHAPAGTPRMIIAQLHADTVRSLRLPDVSERLSSQGAQSLGSALEKFTAFIRSEIDKGSNLVRVAGIRPE